MALFWVSGRKMSNNWTARYGSKFLIPKLDDFISLLLPIWCFNFVGPWCSLEPNQTKNEERPWVRCSLMGQLGCAVDSWETTMVIIQPKSFELTSLDSFGFWVDDVQNHSKHSKPATIRQKYLKVCRQRQIGRFFPMCSKEAMVPWSHDIVPFFGPLE